MMPAEPVRTGLDAIRTELETFDRVKASYLPGHEGSFLLIIGDRVIGVFATREKGIEEGFRLTKGQRPFVCKRIEGTEPVVTISRAGL